MNLSPPKSFDSQSYALAIVEIESLLLSAQFRLQIAALHTSKPAEAERNRTLAGTSLAEAATALARLSMLGSRSTGQ